MPYSIANGDVVQFTCVSRLQNSTILNVFHYVAQVGGTPITDGNTYLNQALTAFQSSVVHGTALDWKGMVTADFTFDYQMAQVVFPARQFFTTLTDGAVGTLAAPSAPADTHLSIRFNTNMAGRGLTGNKKICGLPTAQISGALWNGAALANGALKAADFQLDLVPDITQPLNVLHPIIWSPRKSAQRRSIVSTFVNDEVRVEPSRRFRKGI